MGSGAGRVTVDDGLAFQRREWRVQRVAWLLAALLFALALLGLFGSGPLSWASTGTPDGLVHVQYERFARQLGPTEVEVSIAPEAMRRGQARLRISQEFLDAVTVQSVTPQPSTVVGGSDTLIYVFDVEGAAAPLRIGFSLQTEQTGLQQAEIGIDGGPRIRFWQFVYP